jgi:hypothetical protein
VLYRIYLAVLDQSNPVDHLMLMYVWTSQHVPHITRQHIARVATTNKAKRASNEALIIPFLGSLELLLLEVVVLTKNPFPFHEIICRSRSNKK